MMNEKNVEGISKALDVDYEEKETPKNDMKRISKMIVEEMSSVVKSDQHSFSIPLTVDLNTGENWGKLH